jgi:transcriptional regulator with XRE-family HTH domain
VLVNSKKLKQLRLAKNWTQQHLADVCDLSMRTIQRVEKDGVASNETVAAYAAIFELDASDFIVTSEAYESRGAGENFSGVIQILMGALFIGGFVAGIAITLWLS